MREDIGMNAVARIGLLAILFSLASPSPHPASSGSEADLETLWREGEEAFSRGDLESALESFAAAREKDRDQARTWNYLGGIHFERKDYDKALLHFRHSLSLDPGDPRVYNNIGTAYERLGQLRQAEEYYLKAIETDPDYASSHRNLGVLYDRRLDHPELARRHWEQYLLLVPAGPETHEIREALEKLRGERTAPR
jgi:tetratricopeptide (TPR) repeat protein